MTTRWNETRLSAITAIVVVTLVVFAFGTNSSETRADGNRLTYLNEPIDPYYVGRHFPRLTTPQWIGDPHADAVVVLAIDDMRDPAKYEDYLRPILNRLRQLGGRAGMSIMTNQVDPQDAHLRSWLGEGVSLEVHTETHPCPLLKDGDFAEAKRSYDACVDLLNQIPGNSPVAFRMPCCDSLNTPSPRFWTEIFAKRSPGGHFLQLDSSVFNITTSADTELPRAWVEHSSDGRQRFDKYVPFPSFANTIEDYPYPYLIGGNCWEFPCFVPSDWEAQNLQQPNNPATVEDLKIGIDVVVKKQGVLNLVFHPHGWIRNDQIVELIDAAHQKYAGRVEFLSFRDAIDRIQEHLLLGVSVRDDNPSSPRVRLLDINADGYTDVLMLRADNHVVTRIWLPGERRWTTDVQDLDNIRCLGIFGQQVAGLIANQDGRLTQHQWNGHHWATQPIEIAVDSLSDAWKQRLSSLSPSTIIIARDVDHDGTCELLLSEADDSLILQRGPEGQWRATPFRLPDGVRLSDADRDLGLRWVDVDGDGRDDCLFSDHRRYSLHLWESPQTGWARQVFAVERADTSADKRDLPPFVRSDGTNNGVWIHSKTVWWQNEQTDRLPDLVDRRSFDDLLSASETPLTRMPPPLDPNEALAAFQHPDDVRIELVAAEPLIEDPVAFDWGPDGRLWVVEMRDYPSGMDGAGAPGGRVKVLTDVDQDGRYDRATVFLDQLPFPTGVKVWRDGVLVAAAPEVFWAADTDGDDRADERIALLRGFGEGNQQHRVNGLVWGVDHWIHLANGDSGGQIVSLKTEQLLDLRGRDVRFRPDPGTIQLTSGQTQFGRCTNNDGDWFGGNNSYPLWHYVLEDHYLQRNSHFVAPNVIQHLPRQTSPAPIFPTSKPLPRFNDFDRLNRITSACGPMIDRDHLFDDGRHEFSYVCEPVHNLVHRERLTRDGASFRSERIESEMSSEFLTSTDNWFRPVLVRNGPDGAIWLADMYRLVIEHPTWIPNDWQQKLNLRAGDNRGRIYRIVSRHETADSRPLRLDLRSSDELVANLNDPRAAVRDLAQQLLLWRNDVGVSPRLRELIANSNGGAGRLHALYLLDAFANLDNELLGSLIDTNNPIVARHAMRLAESRLSTSPALGEAMLNCLSTSDPALRLQLANSLGEWPDERAASGLAQLLTTNSDDMFLWSAAISSLNSHNIDAVTAELLPGLADKLNESSLTIICQQIASFGRPESIRLVLDWLAGDADSQASPWRWKLTAALWDEVSRRKDLPEDVRRRLREAVSEIAKLAFEYVFQTAQPLSRRLEAMTLLRKELCGDCDIEGSAQSLIDSRTPPELQEAAVNLLVNQFPQQASSVLLTDWEQKLPRLRRYILDQIAQRKNLVHDLVNALPLAGLQQDLDARRRQQLLEAMNDADRQRWLTYFPESIASSRQAIVDQHRDALMLEGDAVKGREVFANKCATCHRMGELGHAVGPNLLALTDRSPEALLTAILDPNRAVEATYFDYLIETDDGQQFSGMIERETSSGIALLGPDARRQLIPRAHIEYLQSLGRSMMPEGLEQDLTQQQIADVIQFVRSNASVRKQFEGNEPQAAPVRNDGSVRLFAVHAEIYGPTLVFEPTFRNLGYWQSRDDYATWTVELKKPTTFRVAIDYACPAADPNHQLRISCDDQSLTTGFPSTGSWDEYRSHSVGTIRLPAGSSRVVVRSNGPVEGYLLDLRTIFLYPLASD